LAIDGPRNPISSNYLVLVYSPSLSSHLGTSTGVAGVRLAGFQAIQGTSTSASVLYQDGFNRSTRGRTCSELYGSDFSGFAQSGMIWAGEMSLSLLAPAANVVGAVYEGALSLCQIPISGLSVSKLIQLSQKTHTGGTQFTLKGAVVNHDLIFGQHDGQGVEVIYEDLALETVHYLVFQTPVISITSGAAAAYSFLTTIKGNYLFWPKATDPFANRLGQTQTQADKYLDNQVAKSDIPMGNYNWYDPLVQTGKEIAGTIISSFGGPVLGTVANKALNWLSSNHAGVSGSGQARQAIMDSVDTRRRRVNVHGSGGNYILRCVVLQQLEAILSVLKPNNWLYSDVEQLNRFKVFLEDKQDWYESQPECIDNDPKTQLIERRNDKLEKPIMPKSDLPYQDRNRSLDHEDSFRR